MRWPWTKPEERNAPDPAGDYTAAALDAQLAQATAGHAEAGATAAVEAASGLVARAFAVADVDGVPLEPRVMALVGRSLVRKGECVLIAETRADGAISLLPAQSWSVHGGADPDTWTYEVTLGGPSVSSTYRRAGRDRIVHVIPNADPAQPWRGISALDAAVQAGRLNANLSKALADEAGGPRGQLMFAPNLNPERVAGIGTVTRSNPGGLVVVTYKGTNALGASPSPTLQRFGSDVPAHTVELYRRSYGEVLAAIGIPPALVEATGVDGASRRETYRQFLHTLVAPWGNLLAAELSRVLERPVGVDWTELRAADLQARARSWKQLTDARKTAADADRIVGFTDG